LPKEGRAHPDSRKSKSFVRIVSDLKALLRNRAIVGLAVASGCRNIAQNGLYLFLPLYLINELKTGAIWMGMVMMALQIGGLVSGPVAGIWSDRAGRRPVMLWGLAGSAVLLALITPFPSPLVVTSVVTVAGCFLFSVRPVVHSWMMDLSPPTYFGTTTSILFGTQAIMTVVAMPIGGLIADSYGLASVFYFLAAMALIAYLLVLLLPIPAAGEATRT
jgi:FSR family fosmidomycin resistance protein-like MFS transporter